MFNKINNKTQKQLIDEWIKLKPKTTPIVFTKINPQRIAIKDESNNTTDSYKAKHGWMMGFHYLKNYFGKNFVYYLGSTGNAGIADFAYADLLNKLLGEKKVIVVNFYPKHYDDKLLGPDSKGRYTNGKQFRLEMEKYLCGELIRVDFKEKYWFDNFETNYTPCLDKMNELEIGKKIGLKKITRKNSMDITEGFKPTYNQVMKETINQIKEQYGFIPKTLAIIQYGAGMLFDDSKALAKKLPIDFMAVSSGNKNTIADKICDSSESWQENITKLREQGSTKAKNDGSIIHHVEEQEIIYAMKQFDKLEIESEPSGAVGMAIIPRLSQLTDKTYELIIVINTGNGFKKTAHQP